MSIINLFLLLFFLKTQAQATEIFPSESLSNTFFSVFEMIEKTENLNIIYQDDNIEKVSIDNISCVYEMYYACSFMARNQGQNTLVVNTDQALYLMETFVKAGVVADEENSRLDVQRIECQKRDLKTSCQLYIQDPE